MIYKNNMKRRKRIGITFLGIVFLVLLFYSLKESNNLLFPNKIIKDTIYLPFRVLNSNYSNIETGKIKELETEINELKSLLELNHLASDFTYINATVIYRDLSTFEDVITLDKGEKDGIEKDMAVITKDGLIGKVTKTSYLTSTVKLITSSNFNSKISVKIENDNKYLYGLLTGYKDGYYIVELTTNDEISTSSMVLTTGLGGIFPSGIFVGNVYDSQLDNFELSRIVKVAPSANYNDINYVKVIKRKDI